MSSNQQVITIDDISEANAPAIYVKDGLKPFLQAVKDEVSSQVPDLTTAKGRDGIASLAAKVSKSKVAVEKPGREYLRRLKEMPKVVKAELRQQQAREADKAHKGAIYKAAKEAFIQHGMTEECARLAVKLVASGLIPSMSIQY